MNQRQRIYNKDLEKQMDLITILVLASWLLQRSGLLFSPDLLKGSSGITVFEEHFQFS